MPLAWVSLCVLCIGTSLDRRWRRFGGVGVNRDGVGRVRVGGCKSCDDFYRDIHLILPIHYIVWVHSEAPIGPSCMRL